MPIPIKLLLAAAALARDEETQKTVKAVWKAGGEMVDKASELSAARARRAKGKAPEGPTSALALEAAPAKGKVKKRTGWRGGLERRVFFRSGRSGDLIRFDYRDEHGLTSHRMVGNWRCEGGELIGYCLNRKEEVAFDVDGISEWKEVPVGRPEE